MQFGRKTHLAAIVLVCLLPNVVLAKVTTCPPLNLVQKKPGQNNWITLIPGWDGRFDSPQIGQGFSDEVSNFIGVRWVKLNNLPDSPGKIECDYEGNFSTETEVIRFDQASYFSTKKPIGDNWSCQVNGDFPSTVCECTMGIEYCTFDSDVPEVKTSGNFEDTRTLLDREYIK